MPVNINLLSDDTIARGITPPDIGNFGTALTGTQDYFQKQALQNLFAGGLPRDPNNPTVLDYGKMAEMLARTGGAGQLQNVLGLIGAEQQSKLPPIPTVSMPPESMPQQRSVLPGSAQRDGLRPASERTSEEDQGGGVPKTGDVNVVQKDEVPGSVATMSVDGGPQEKIPERPVQVASNAPIAPQFTRSAAPPTPGRPVSGPDATRFAQSQIPAIPAQQASPNFGGDTAARWDMIANSYREAARRAELPPAPNKGLADTYRAQASDAAANAKMIREGLIGAQRKQAETQVEQEKGIFDEGRKNYGTAQEINFRLGVIDDSIKKLGPQWMGAGANARAGFARTYNTTLDFVPDVIKKEFGLTPFDPAKVASWEDFNKQTQQLGFALARTLGAREAMQIVQAAVASVPNAEQSYWGAQLVSSSMRQAAQREIDYHKYLIQLRRDNKSVLDADVSFNQQRPVQSYVDKALSVLPPQAPPMEKRKVGEYYQTPRGFGIWRGNNTWEFP